MAAKPTVTVKEWKCVKVNSITTLQDSLNTMSAEGWDYPPTISIVNEDGPTSYVCMRKINKEFHRIWCEVGKGKPYIVNPHIFADALLKEYRDVLVEGVMDNRPAVFMSHWPWEGQEIKYPITYDNSIVQSERQTIATDGEG